MGRFVFVVLDGVGVGALPDALEYGDAGSDTLGNLARVVPLHLPLLERCGLGNIAPLTGVAPTPVPLCLPGRLAPRSVGKDTTVGHWEHMGLVTAAPFPTYPHGFPQEIITSFEAQIGRTVLGNRPASGTAVIEELGEEHVATGRPIVYTSADSVFQIAAHVDVVPLETLYGWCRMARDLLRGRHAVARVIARPFTGRSGAFVRTPDRRDFSLEPPGPTYLDVLHEAGVPVLALGKISEVFVGRGVSDQVRVGSNDENLSLLTALTRGKSPRASFAEGLLITNLVDFDMVWGHRNDAEGFARGLEAVDAALPAVLASLRPDDRLLITADHGVDPTTPSTDHSREYVPVLLYPRPGQAPDSVYEGTFSDTGATVYEHLTGLPAGLGGTSMSRLRPARGWRRYTAVQPSVHGSTRALPVRVGAEEAAEAGRWLAQHIGPAPGAAVVLGSGLSPALPEAALVDVPYGDIPHWRSGHVEGHAYRLSVVQWCNRRVALLRGRIHEYEGYDLGEVQLPVRSLAVWGVSDLVLTSASGAVAEELRPGEVVAVDEVFEPQWLGEQGIVRRQPLTTNGPIPAGLRRGMHASLPGPQYETPAELVLLRRLGAVTVSMSPGGELRAALEAGMNVVVLAVVANAGETTHDDVLQGTARAARGLAAAAESLLEVWGGPARPV